MILSWAVRFTRAKPGGICRRATRRKAKQIKRQASALATVRRGQRCAHCRRRRLWLRRGLCSRCYADPLTKGRYFTPEKTLLARNPDMRDALDLLSGVDIQAAEAGPCPGPLPAGAGSAERLLALGLRADAKCVLFPPRPGGLSLEAVGRLFGVDAG